LGGIEGRGLNGAGEGVLGWKGRAIRGFSPRRPSPRGQGERRLEKIEASIRAIEAGEFSKIRIGPKQGNWGKGGAARTNPEKNCIERIDGEPLRG